MERSARILGTGGAILAWLGWFEVSPALGFPTIGTAAMLNRVLVPDSDPGVWVGWATLVAGLVGLAIVYGLATRRRRFRAGVASGIVYGVAAWAVAGAVIMPVLGVISPPVPPPPLPPGVPPPLTTPDPMQGTFMMLSLGPLAPVSALIAWTLFGVALGATFEGRSGEAAEAGSHGRRTPRLRARTAGPPIALALAAVLVLAAGAVAATRATSEQALKGGTTRVLARGDVPELPEGPVFVSVVELRQPPGATLGPHSHVPGFTHAADGEAVIAFEEGPTMRLQPGEAGFMGGLVVHSHGNERGRVPAGMLAAGLILVVVLLAAAALRRTGGDGLMTTLGGLLVVGGVLAVLNPWANEWLFVGIRPESARGAAMPLPDAHRIYESPDLAIGVTAPYEESLALVSVNPHQRVRVAGEPGPTTLLILEGEAEVKRPGASSVRLGPDEATLVQEGSYEVVNRGTGPLRLLSFKIGPKTEA